ncbi:MAG: carbon-nitrogen hydrolase family protein [Polyangia bacterium]
MKTFRASVVQTLARLGDLDENIGILRARTAEAVGQGASLVVFPECMNTGYLFDSRAHCLELAEPTDGRYAQAMSQLARQYGVFIASGFTERVGDRAFNSGLLFDPRGELILRYQKQFLATHDQNWFEVGAVGCPVVETELGKIGLLICFDGRIPEIARCLALQGAQVICDMANFFTMDQADLWVPARAYENGVWIVAATKAGVERSIYYPGGSLIVDPTGTVRARVANDTHGVATAEVQPDSALDKRWHHDGDRRADRRPAAYQLLRAPFESTPVSAVVGQSVVPAAATVAVGAVQAHGQAASSGGGVEPSIREALDMVGHAAQLGIRLIVLPQYFNAGTWAPDLAQADEAAARVPAIVDRARQVATDGGCAIVLPLIERTSGRLRSTALVVGPTGDVIGAQSQVHVEPEARAWCTPGERFEPIETPWGRLGIIVGYDGLFAESARTLALAGADVVAWPCAWRQRQDRALLAVPQAEDNRVYLVCANRTDAPYPGGSVVIPPSGIPVWDLDQIAPPVTRHGAVVPTHANLALSRQKLMIPNVDMLRNRLVATYGPMTDA